VSLSQPGRAGLGAQAGPAKTIEVIRGGGFSDVRVVASSPTNFVIAARV
jgi:hypothetical protein